MDSIIIFGATEQAEVANYYFKKAGHTIDFHCVDDEYFNNQKICGTPVLSLSEITQKALWQSHRLHIAMGFSNHNTNRRSTFEKMKTIGFSFVSYISPHATVLTDNIGENCFILENNVVQPFVKIGDNVVLWSGNHIGHHSIIEDNVFLSSHVVISGNCTVGRNCFVGVNATVIDGVIIGENNIIGANALIKRNTKKGEVYPVLGTQPR